MFHGSTRDCEVTFGFLRENDAHGGTLTGVFGGGRGSVGRTVGKLEKTNRKIESSDDAK